jgi:HEAT repeat protein
LLADSSNRYRLADVKSGEIYRVQVSVQSGALRPEDHIEVTLTGPDRFDTKKILHAGDPDLYITYRPTQDGEGAIVLDRSQSAASIPVSVDWARIPLAADERAAVEAEPNDDWRHANPLILGRDVYGSADDVDYLENRDEGKSGLDWFKIEVEDMSPILVYFQLDLLDRDVSANLRLYTVGKDGTPAPYELGKDPMEIVHDRERERYSKHISRTLTKGTYFLEVNANHPDYILRTRKLPVPPYTSPALAVEAGMHYAINVGDAWFAQIPREGNIYTRSANMHDTATRCTACHASSFSTEPNLVAHRAGYPIRSKSNMLYVMDRIANSITPLYGDEGLYWQRFIAIPLQAQGKQGGILADFEREVSGKQTKAYERFGPFLKAAWADRKTLPDDEQNGVLPLDSKFGIAWRDWRVLKEMAARTRGAEYEKAAENVERLVAEPAADRRVETLQDRIHRLYALSLFDEAKYADRVRAEAEQLLALQNEDGGWHETDGKKGPSAVYTTGQLVLVLLKIGYSRDEPRIQRALRYLLSQQQAFGGWIQTTTHENFRTPMRETRYAVEALAEAYPHTGAPLVSWGNRDGRPARLPRDDSVVAIIDDLENLWDVPIDERPRFAREIAHWLDHREPLVRAAAAACLGRLERPEAVEPLINRLADPSKIVWRAAAWALRRIGNAGHGVDQILAALKRSDPLTRRGATRIFAYQFHGMDERLDLAYRLIDLTDDTDLWTRLQALKTLRQWFYRTSNANLRRRVIRAYLARMAAPEVPVVRRNLSEGMYIMLDENLGGGVSLQKNIAQLPEPQRPKILEARKNLERGVLLSPLLSALESGNDLQREAILRSFDGSFFKGRFYARRPEGMIDVGNDREFGFLYEAPTDLLERTFAAVFEHESRPELRRQAILLSSFFRLPERSDKVVIQSALLAALGDQDADVRSAARRALGDNLSLRGAENDAKRRAQIRETLRKADAATLRILGPALSRNRALVADPEILAELKSQVSRPEAAVALRAVLALPEFSDEECLAAVVRAWSLAANAGDKIALFDLLTARKALLDSATLNDRAVSVVRAAITDASPLVREHALVAVSSLERFRASHVSGSLLLSALADDTPALRVVGIKLASEQARFWDRADARELLAQLLIDPSAAAREAALAAAEQRRLLVGSSALAKRVKALEADPQLKARARAALLDQGFDATSLVADVELSRPRLLNVSAFRRDVNPLFYKPGADGHACAGCHATHTILRIAESGGGKKSGDEALMINYASALKAINLGDPESSLLLRKPRSPEGQGGADPSSPTGFSHVGGPRWETTEDPSYHAILGWIRQAAVTAHDEANTMRFSAGSFSPEHEPANVGDGDVNTFWHTEFVGGVPGYPHEVTIDLGAQARIEGLLYVPRQDSSRGRVKDYEIRVSSDGKTWSPVLAAGSWPDDAAYKYASVPAQDARYVQLRGLSEVNGLPYMSAAEIQVDATRR